MVRIGDSGQSEIADLQIASRVQQQVRGLEVTVQHVGGVDVLQAAEDLVQEVADVVVAQTLKNKNRKEYCNFLKTFILSPLSFTLEEPSYNPCYSIRAVKG